jgi:hypothetical protein
MKWSMTCGVDVGILSCLVGNFMKQILGSPTGRRHEWFVLWHVDHVEEVTRKSTEADMIC